MNGTAMTILSDDLISRCGSRAAAYDRENRFFTEDFAELRAAGYLKMAVPEHLGGRGMSLAEICREQRRLAYRAPATALATNMHLYWTGVAADMRKAGDSSLEWILEEAAAGEVFAAGHGGPRTGAAGGSGKGPPPARSSRPATARRATTCRSSCRQRRPSAPTAAIGSG